MNHDVVDLRDFYETPLGKVAASLITKQIQGLWPNLSKQSLLGIGYPLPYLIPYLDQAESILAFMPAQQGVVNWPEIAPSLTVLVEENSLPLPDQSIDHILIVHGLEQMNQARPFLREIWRVLKASGRLLVIVPNRRGLWARMDSTPFGQGHPYTMTQLSHVLRDNLFTPLHSTRGLYIFPSSSRFLLSTQPVWEKIGSHTLQKFSGIICIEAIKQVYAGTPIKSRKPVILPTFAGIRG